MSASLDSKVAAAVERFKQVSRFAYASRKLLVFMVSMWVIGGIGFGEWVNLTEAGANIRCTAMICIAALGCFYFVGQSFVDVEKEKTKARALGGGS